MAWANPNSPNLPDFLLFIADDMQIPATALPAGSPWPGYAFTRAGNLVPQLPTIAGSDYTLTYYNCAAHILLAIAPDQPGQNYFATARDEFDLLEPSSGVISASSDQGTSNTLEVPESLKKLTVGNLFFFKTPWGRYFLTYCQDFGEICGLT